MFRVLHGSQCFWFLFRHLSFRSTAFASWSFQGVTSQKLPACGSQSPGHMIPFPLLSLARLSARRICGLHCLHSPSFFPRGRLLPSSFFSRPVSAAFPHLRFCFRCRCTLLLTLFGTAPPTSMSIFLFFCWPFRRFPPTLVTVGILVPIFFPKTLARYAQKSFSRRGSLRAFSFYL